MIVPSRAERGTGKPAGRVADVPFRYTISMEALRIALYGAAALGAYGLVHDQVTASIGAGWGWFPGLAMGAVYGLGLATVARLGRRPKRGSASLIKPIVFLIAVTAGFALLAGIVGFLLAKAGPLKVNPDAAVDVPPAKQAAMIACGMAHMAAWYVACIAGGIQAAVVWVVRNRTRHVSAGLTTAKVR